MDTSEGTPAGSGSRVLTVPNAISALRIALIPVFVWLIVDEDTTTAGLIMFGFVVATDWIDGTIARRTGQVSELGKVLDPVADRLLFFVGIAGILLVDPPGAPVWFCWMVIAREVFVSAATLGLAAMGAKRIDVTWFGKAGTFGLMFAFPLFLAGSSSKSSAPIFQALGWMTGVPGLLLSYYAAVLYIPIGLRALREGRAARSSPTAG
jgi:cardiolipin synthase